MFKIIAGALATNEVMVKYYSGGILTKEKFKYGKFRASMTVENRKGSCAAFFTYKPRWRVDSLI